MLFCTFHSILIVTIINEIDSAVDTETTSSPLEVTVFIENLRLLQVDEHSSTMSLALSLCTYWTAKRQSNDLVQRHVPELIFEKVIEETRFHGKLDKLPESRKRQCHSAVVTVLCSHFEMSNYPKDKHNCDLLLMAKENASNIILLPHLHTSENDTLGNAEWSMVHIKTIVQWVTVEYEDFEMVVISFVISRNSILLEVIQWSTFLLNVFLIFLAFPANSFASVKDANANQLLAPFCQVALWIAVAFLSPATTDHPLIVQRVFYFLTLSVIVSVMGYLAPLMTLSLHCVPYHAHPCPIDFPTPSELLSLDSERARYSSILNSARDDAPPSQRNVNADLCMAQVRYTLSAVNDFLAITASAKWHRRQWLQGFARIQMLLLILFQTLNLILFLICSGS